MELFNHYSSSVIALGALALMMLAQLLILDGVGIKRRHKPGYTIPSDHGDMHFRTFRTVANTNESIGIFLVAYLFAVMSGTSPVFVAYLTWGFVCARMCYAVLYYLNLQTLRSISFVFVLTTIGGLIVAGIHQWLTGAGS